MDSAAFQKNFTLLKQAEGHIGLTALVLFPVARVRPPSVRMTFIPCAVPHPLYPVIEPWK